MFRPCAAAKLQGTSTRAVLVARTMCELKCSVRSGHITSHSHRDRRLRPMPLPSAWPSPSSAAGAAAGGGGGRDPSDSSRSISTSSMRPLAGGGGGRCGSDGRPGGAAGLCCCHGGKSAGGGGPAGGGGGGSPCCCHGRPGGGDGSSAPPGGAGGSALGRGALPAASSRGSYAGEAGCCGCCSCCACAGCAGGAGGSRSSGRGGGSSRSSGSSGRGGGGCGAAGGEGARKLWLLSLWGMSGSAAAVVGAGAEGGLASRGALPAEPICAECACRARAAPHSTLGRLGCCCCPCCCPCCEPPPGPPDAVAWPPPAPTTSALLPSPDGPPAEAAADPCCRLMGECIPGRDSAGPELSCVAAGAAAAVEAASSGVALPLAPAAPPPAPPLSGGPPSSCCSRLTSPAANMPSRHHIASTLCTCLRCSGGVSAISCAMLSSCGVSRSTARRAGHTARAQAQGSAAGAAAGCGRLSCTQRVAQHRVPRGQRQGRRATARAGRPRTVFVAGGPFADRPPHDGGQGIEHLEPAPGGCRAGLVSPTDRPVWTLPCLPPAAILVGWVFERAHPCTPAGWRGPVLRLEHLHLAHQQRAHVLVTLRMRSMGHQHGSGCKQATRTAWQGNPGEPAAGFARPAPPPDAPCSPRPRPAGQSPPGSPWWPSWHTAAAPL